MGNFFKKCLPPSNPYIEYVAPVNPVTTTAAPDYKYFLIPSSGTICPPQFLIQGNCNCGSLFISKNFGLNIDGNIVKFSHNQDVLLNNNQAFIATTDKLNIANINDIDIDLFTNVVLKNKIQVIIKINETNQPIAYSVIGNDSQNYTINTINLCLQEPISLNNESLRIEFYSLCYSIDKNDCCDKLPSTITLVDTTTLLPCPTTTTTTTTTLPPFCSRFNLPNLFYATVTAGYPLDRQEKVSLFVRNGNTYSTTGIFPCGTNYTLSMTCDPITQKFYYDGFIDCCDQNTKSVANETSRPLIVPGAVLPSIIFYENCENCNSICTSTTTSTTQYPDCCNWDGKNQYIEFSCNDQIYSLPFYKIGSNLFEASATLECGDTVRALYRCNSNIPYIDSTSCSQKWEPLSISVPCATNARLTGNVLEPCECDKPPVYEWVADDLSNCECCIIEDQNLYAFYCHPSWQISTSPFPPYNFFSCGSGAGFCNIIKGVVTINKPTDFVNRNTFVKITGSFDDDIAINNIPVGNCLGAHEIDHTFTLSSTTNSFVLGAVDSFGGFSHGILTITFSTSPL